MPEAVQLFGIECIWSCAPTLLSHWDQRLWSLHPNRPECDCLHMEAQNMTAYRGDKNFPFKIK